MHKRKSYEEVRAAREFQMHCWTHNAYFGATARARIFSLNIQSSPSTTPEAKLIAAQIELLSRDLHEALHKRVELDGTVTTFELASERERRELQGDANDRFST